ncbi:HesA/MoeB/ThiF family protein [Nocardia arthritidis]|uniref:ThiF family adenylyltransferase n=1 Tax=Nocardia arthritidis TaxID=228602 RepID=A0A6G9Y7N0_9NOCA|nr:ThiF family adenylyltransferase [Nocardia arthritidis]QIS09076.1 ThiF family adenylyltransferase [Nocardia arthritidis]
MRAVDMVRPRIKPELVPYVTVDGNIRIGATIHGIGVEIADPDGWIRTLIDALDGTRSPGEIIAAVRSGSPGAPVTEALQQLSDAGLLEDAGAPVPPELPEPERYSRGVAFLRWIDRTPRSTAWDMQLRLNRSRVLLIGIGGVGGTVAQGLVASGVGHLHCVDFDTVDLSNLNRQILFREKDIGAPKVEAAVDRLRALNSTVLVTGEQRRVDGRSDIAELLRPGYDLLALCADRPRNIRRWVNRECLAADLPWVVGGYHGPRTSAGMYGPGACWECAHDSDAESGDTRMPAGMTVESLAPQLPWHPVNAVSAGITGNLVTHFALSALTGAPPFEPGSRYEVNLANLEATAPERIPPRPGCPGCGDTR